MPFNLWVRSIAWEVGEIKLDWKTHLLSEGYVVWGIRHLLKWQGTENSYLPWMTAIVCNCFGRSEMPAFTFLQVIVFWLWGMISLHLTPLLEKGVTNVLWGTYFKLRLFSERWYILLRKALKYWSKKGWFSDKVLRVMCLHKTGQKAQVPASELWTLLISSCTTLLHPASRFFR